MYEKEAFHHDHFHVAKFKQRSSNWTWHCCLQSPQQLKLKQIPGERKRDHHLSIFQLDMETHKSDTLFLKLLKKIKKKKNQRLLEKYNDK